MEIKEFFEIAILMISLLFVTIGAMTVMEDVISVRGWVEIMLGMMIAKLFYANN